MFELSVHFLDGSSQSIVPSPTMTVAELRAQIERKLPAFHGIRLLHDTQELLNEAKIQVDVQAVATKYPEEALDVLEKCGLNALDDSDPLVGDAIAMLSEFEELEPMHCERLLNIIQLRALASDIQLKLSTIFGRACGDPMPYLGCALFSVQYGMDFALASYEIAKRCVDTLPSELRMELMILAEAQLNIPDSCSYSLQQLNVPDYLKMACRLLGLFGNEAGHLELLEHARARCAAEATEAIRFFAYGIYAEHDVKLVERAHAELAAEFTEAIRLVHLRIKPAAVEFPSYQAGTQEINDEHDPEELVDVQVSIGDHTVEEEMATLVQETDHDLDKAIQESELEALLQEQEDLHKTILHSKGDCRHRQRREPADGVDQPHGLVLLCFQSCRKELYESLLESPMAVKLAADGVLLQPDFAAGRLILAKDVTEAAISEARSPWHVAVNATDERKLYDTLRECLGRQRPRLRKEDGRFLVPGDVSLFDDASSASEFAMQPEWWELLDIKRTFLHAKMVPKALARRAASAPPAIPIA